MPSFSPRTQSMATPNSTEDQAKSLFDQGLSQMAYNVLTSKLPNIASDVVTFKVLETDPEKGAGIGAFVVLRGGASMYIPVVMAENQIKPLDILYHKNLNSFFPLTKDWLAALEQQGPAALGKGAKPPDGLSTDVDIRNTVVPPTTGRYSYASESVSQAYRVFDEARHQADTTKLSFLSFLEQAPNRVKTAVARLFESRPRLLKQAMYYYGHPALVSALTHKQEKVAAYDAGLSNAGGLYIADQSTSPAEFKDIFGSGAPEAFSGVAMRGYSAKDNRKNLNRAVRTQTELRLQEPRGSGVYRVWTVDGSSVVALVIEDPVDLFAGVKSKRLSPRNIRFVRYSSGPVNPTQGGGAHYRVPGVDGIAHGTGTISYLGLAADGKFFETNRLVAEPLTPAHLKDSSLYEKIFSDIGASLRAGQRGVFVHAHAASFIATTPMKIESVSTMSSGTMRIEVTSGWQKKTLIIDKNAARSKILSSTHNDLVYLPTHVSFVPVSDEIPPRELLSSPRDVMTWATQGLLEHGAEKVSVYRPNRFSGWVVGREELPFVPALKKLATAAHISVADAEYVLKKASEEGSYSFWALSDAAYVKLAAKAGAEPTPEEQAAMEQAQAAQPPPPPSPVDMAVAEQLQSLQQQAQALTQMQQLLMSVQQRANQIATGGGAAGAPAAAAAAMGGPMDPSMMGYGAPVGMQGQPGMDPSQMQGQPGMDPSQMQGDPSQMQQGQPPAATMSADDGSVDTLASQVNPQFMEQAGQLQDAGVFDAASLASMAQSPALVELVTAYLPDLEKTLDSLGRVLLSLWMDESQIKQNLGNDTFIALEDNLRTVFKGLGDLILKVNQNTQILPGAEESVYEG